MEENQANSSRRREWCDLPIELLLLTCAHLSVLDRLSIRSVCRGWRSASSQCLLENQPRDQPPWIMFLKDYDLTSDKLVDSSTNRRYTIHIPELQGRTRVLLSRHGWLLLRSFSKKNRSPFFFNPFSRARIDPPYLNLAGSVMTTFALSAPPTSQDCILFAIGMLFSDRQTFSISTCRRGEDKWTTNMYQNNQLHGQRVLNVVFSKGIFYCFHIGGEVSVFNVENYTWECLGSPFDHMRGASLFLSYGIERCDGKVILYLERKDHSLHKVILEGIQRRRVVKDTKELPVPVPTIDDGGGLLFLTVDEEIAQTQNKDKLVILGSCHGKYDPDTGLITFHWRYSNIEQIYRNCNCKNAIWIEPKWVSPSPSLTWTT